MLSALPIDKKNSPERESRNLPLFCKFRFCTFSSIALGYETSSSQQVATFSGFASPAKRHLPLVLLLPVKARVDQLPTLGMGKIQPLIGNPYNGYINPYYWVDEFIPYYMEIMGV